ETLQRIERSAFESKLTVVVIFDDDGAVLFCPGEQRQSPRERHRDAEWKLMRGRHVNQTGRCRNGRYIDPLVVDRHTCNPRAQALKEPPGRWVAGLLERDDGTWLDQHAAYEVECLLRALRHNHIVGISADRA